MAVTVFSRGVWFPTVVRAGDALRLELAAGADALHDPRVLGFPIRAEHADVLRAELARDLLLWSALLPLWDDAGIRGPLDEGAAVALLDPVLLAQPEEVDALFRTIRWSREQLVAHGADVVLLERGEVHASLAHATVERDQGRVDAYR